MTDEQKQYDKAVSDAFDAVSRLIEVVENADPVVDFNFDQDYWETVQADLCDLEGVEIS